MKLCLDSIVSTASTQLGNGRVADYIPALSTVKSNQVGIAICTIEGQVYTAGDAQKPFSIQSISKLFALIKALEIVDDPIWERIGREASGRRFNSLVQLEEEDGVPRNPFINAGALVTCDLLQERLSAPVHQILTMIRKLANNPSISVNQTVFRSELASSARNAAMAYLMKSYGNFHSDVDLVLANYCQYCAVEMNCEDLAKATVFLANNGASLDEEQILSPKKVKAINALLATCGLYDASGAFAVDVGLLGKSGIGGGIVAINPGKYSVAVFSPELNQYGNSVVGIYLLKLLAEQVGETVF
ncbi:glutaminase B [Aliiglaciecola sp.]|nr:glutaminase B [Aliiglaciecola sp.]